MKTTHALLFVAVLILPASTLWSDDDDTPTPRQSHEDYLRENYLKTEHMVPMRDGVRLFTIVYAPRDDTQEYPVMLFPDALFNRSVVRGGPFPIAPRTYGGVRPGRIHLRLPGRTREVPLGGGVRGDQAAGPGSTGIGRGGREHGQLRHHRMGPGPSAQRQRQGRPVGHLVPGLADRHGHGGPPPRPGGVVPTGVAFGHVHR